MTLYRVRWVAKQEDGGLVTLTGVETESLFDARKERDYLLTLDYIVNAWIEKATWTRVSQIL